MRILAIDPGSEQSAAVIYDDGEIIWHAFLPNEEMIMRMFEYAYSGTHLAIEYTKAHTLQFKGKNRSFFPQQVLDTARWVGRFEQAFGGPFTEIDRRQVKQTLGVPPNGTDAHVNAALYDRFGDGTRKSAVGTKKNPGPCYGLKADLWQALAVAVTFADQQEAVPC